MQLPAINLKGVSGVYCALHRETGRCYIGSSTNVLRRYHEHVRNSRAGRTFFYEALRTYGIASFDFELLEECSPSALKARECFYIRLFNAASLEGFNTLSDPRTSSYGCKCSDAVRARMSASAKGKSLSAETRAKISRALRGRKGKPLTPEKLARLVACNKGRRLPAEHRAKMSAARKGKRHTLKSRIKMSESRKGMVFSPEHCASMSRVRKGRNILTAENLEKLQAGNKARIRAPMSSAQKAHLSVIFKGKPHKSETRTKMHLSQQRRRQLEADLASSGK